MAKFAVLNAEKKVVQVRDSETDVDWMHGAMTRLVEMGYAIELRRPEEIANAPTLVGAFYEPNGATFHKR